jgi:hypothetical protein
MLANTVTIVRSVSNIAKSSLRDKQCLSAVRSLVQRLLNSFELVVVEDIY